jgi:hypothetical protein
MSDMEVGRGCNTARWGTIQNQSKVRMALRRGISRERARRRRQFLFYLTVWLAAVGVFAAIGYSSYRTGSALADRELVAGRAEIEGLKAQADADRLADARLHADLAQAQQAMTALQQRYDADVPGGGLAALVAILRQKQAAGVKDDRIAQVLREIDAPRPCGDRVARRRLTIATKAAGQDDAVSFLDGLIQVSASMAAGGVDLAKSTVVTISRAWTAEPIKLNGLPAQHVITIYNITLTLVVEVSTIPGYAEASLSTCGKG